MTPPGPNLEACPHCKRDHLPPTDLTIVFNGSLFWLIVALLGVLLLLGVLTSLGGLALVVAVLLMFPVLTPTWTVLACDMVASYLVVHGIDKLLDRFICKHYTETA